MNKQWEYTVVSLAVKGRKELLDICGEQGWELVSIVQDSDDRQALAYFKRKKYAPLNSMRIRRSP